MSSSSPNANDIDLGLGFTVGLEMPFDDAVEWAAAEDFDFVELLLDGPYARERIAHDQEAMRETLAEAGLDIVVHLPFAVDPGSPFTPVRNGAIEELTAGMDFAADLAAEKV
ncbi:TIM barrel protein, partial [Natronomonas sp.]|uniref:TIM barrel protein n=1 Tax=Natronomonas sp. TaxID=2184060 RepID=UPI002FC2E2A5